MPHGTRASSVLRYARRYPVSRTSLYPTDLCPTIKPSRKHRHVSLTERLLCLIRPWQQVSRSGRGTHEHRTITLEPFMRIETVVVLTHVPSVDLQNKSTPPTYLRRDGRTARLVYKALAIRRSLGQQAARVFLVSMGVTASLAHRVVSSPVEQLRR